MNNPYGSPNPPPWVTGHPQSGTGHPQSGRATGGRPAHPPGPRPGGMAAEPPDPYSRGTRSDQYANGPLQPGAAAVGGFPDPLADRGKQRRRRRRVWPWLLGFVMVLAMAVVGFLGFVAPGWFYRPVLDADSVRSGVGQILRDSYGLGGVDSIDCPAAQAVQPGHRFQCGVVIDGNRMRVEVTVRDEQGTYAVSRPS